MERLEKSYESSEKTLRNDLEEEINPYWLLRRTAAIVENNQHYFSDWVFQTLIISDRDGAANMSILLKWHYLTKSNNQPILKALLCRKRQY